MIINTEVEEIHYCTATDLEVINFIYSELETNDFSAKVKVDDNDNCSISLQKECSPLIIEISKRKDTSYSGMWNQNKTDIISYSIYIIYNKYTTYRSFSNFSLPDNNKDKEFELTKKLFDSIIEKLKPNKIYKGMTFLDDYIKQHIIKELKEEKQNGN